MAPVRSPPIEILVVCTGNICRSPMAELLLRDRLGRRGVTATVRSAGTRAVGGAASVHSVDVLADAGLDLGAHQSRQLARTEVGSADLVLAMAREHLREAVVSHPGSFYKSFTLKELVRRAEAADERAPDEDVEAWLRRVGAGRSTAGLMGSDARDDVADPIGRPRADYERTYDELVDLIDRLVAVGWPTPSG